MKKFYLMFSFLFVIMMPMLAGSEESDESKGNDNNAYVVFLDNPWRKLQINTVYGLNLGLPISGKADFVEGADINFGWSTTKVVDGAQISLFGNQKVIDCNGVQIASIWNYVKQDVYGVQASLFYNNIARDMVGVQLGCVNNAERNCEGVQVSTINTVNKTLSGLQIGCLNWATKYCKGIQISCIVNVTKKLKGMQIGLINIANHANGIQIGVFNYIKESRIPFMPLINID